MHIVVIAWLFVIGLMALTLRPLAGVAFFLGVGLAPVALGAWIALRRLKRRAGASVLEQQVNAADDRHAQSDQ